MKITYDPRQNIAYIALREKSAHVETIRIGDELNIDLTADGAIHGIELLDANDQLAGGNDGLLTVVNESNGKTEKIHLNL